MTITETPEQLQCRLANRQSAKEDLAGIQIVQMRLRELEQGMRESDERIDQATSEHQATTAPVQTRIDEVNQQMTLILARREEIPQAMLNERKELLGRIDQANRELQLHVAAEKKIRENLQKEFDEERMKTVNKQVIENSLCGDLAKPEWRLQHFAQQQAIKWAVARSRAASAECERWRELAASSKRNGQSAAAADYLERMQRWQAEANVAGEAQRAAEQAMADLREKMFNE